MDIWKKKTTTVEANLVSLNVFVERHGDAESRRRGGPQGRGAADPWQGPRQRARGVARTACQPPGEACAAGKPASVLALAKTRVC